MQIAVRPSQDEKLKSEGSLHLHQTLLLLPQALQEAVEEELLEPLLEVVVGEVQQAGAVFVEVGVLEAWRVQEENGEGVFSLGGGLDTPVDQHHQSGQQGPVLQPLAGPGHAGAEQQVLVPGLLQPPLLHLRHQAELRQEPRLQPRPGHSGPLVWLHFLLPGSVKENCCAKFFLTFHHCKSKS